ISHAFKHHFREVYTQPKVIVNISGISLEIPLIYRTSDPVKGEIIQPVFVTQAAMIEIEEEELILINQSSGKLNVKISPWVDADSLVISSSDFDERGGYVVHRNISAGQTININLGIPSEGDFEIALAINGDTVRQIVKGIY